MVVSRLKKVERVLLLHGLLLLAVVLTAYFSVQAQYQSLSDQSVADSEADLQTFVRTGADTLQQQLRLLIGGLWDPALLDQTRQQLPGGLVEARLTIDSAGHVVQRDSGDGTTIDRALSQAPWLNTVARPSAAVVAVDGSPDDDARILLAVPMRQGQRTAIILLSRAALAANLVSATLRQSPPPVCLTDPSGRVLAAVDAPAAPQWLQSTLSPSLQQTLNATLKSGLATTSFLDPGVAGSAERSGSLMAVRAIEPVAGLRWYVVAVRTDVRGAISRNLRPVFWQLISVSVLMVVATVVVMVSTTLSLQRGRLRIERLRMQMIDRDLQKARRIQLNWLPAPLHTADHLTIAAENRPALHISGDFYNWFELPAGEEGEPRKTVLVIGDVSGHGLPAAFLMATAQLLVRNTMPSVRDPGACLGEVNRQLCSLVYGGQFVTMMIVVIDHDLGGIQIASAGQAPPLLRRGESVESLDIDPQLVAGVDRSVEYPTHRVRVRPGDLLLLYTDGAVESPCDTGQQFGIERLSDAIRRGDDPQAIVRNVVAALKTHCGEHEFDDDLTLVAVQLAQLSPAGPDEPAAVGQSANQGVA